MNVLHISDLHFGPRHWDGNDKILMKKSIHLTAISLSIPETIQPMDWKMNTSKQDAF